MGPIGRAAAVLTLFAAGWASASGQSAPAQGVIALDPQRVGIDLRYNGATVTVRAEVPAGYEAALRLQAPPGRLELKRMGKKAGVLWMGVGEVTFENVPALYQVLTTAPLDKLGSPEALAQWKLGYETLVPDGARGADLRGDLVGLKEQEGLFALQPGSLTREASAMAKSPVLASISETGTAPTAAALAVPQVLQGTFHLPARARAGDYTVDLIGFKDGRAFHLGSATLRLEQVGLAQALSGFAHVHGLAYGIAACVIAILVGLLTGLIFQPKGDESH